MVGRECLAVGCLGGLSIVHVFRCAWYSHCSERVVLVASFDRVVLYVYIIMARETTPALLRPPFGVGLVWVIFRRSH